MQTTQEKLTLRDGALNITIEAYGMADFERLTPEARWALVQAGVDGWKFRGACKQTKEDGFVNDGKTFKLADIAADLLSSPTRSSGPSKADKERGDDLADRARKACPVEESEDAEEARRMALAKRREWITAKFEAAKTDKPWVEWEWNDALTLEENCHRVQWAVRQPKPEPKKSTKYI